MSCYIVQEVDGTSRFTLEDASGSLLLEFCPPAGAGNNPMGGLASDGTPIRGYDRRRKMQQVDDEIFILFYLTEV